MNERPVLSKLSHEEKDALIGVLLRRLEKQDERIKELERRLGLNSGNSGKPPSSNGYGKKPSCVYRKLDSAILVVKATENRV
jgi:hypothetical protein